MFIKRKYVNLKDSILRRNMDVVQTILGIVLVLLGVTIIFSEATVPNIFLLVLGILIMIIALVIGFIRKMVRENVVTIFIFAGIFACYNIYNIVMILIE